MTDQLHYGNWIRLRTLLILGLSAMGLGIFGLFLSPWIVRAAVELLSILLFISFLYPFVLYCVFAPQGGNFQARMYKLIAEQLGAELHGEALDIGTGNGVLAIELAQRFPGLRVTGMDHWGRSWEYSRRVCDRNAGIAGVRDRVRFTKGDAARLDFGETCFDAVVSNLTFHEVRSVPDKKGVVGEALRVLKPGGRFVFVDYFYAEKYYGKALDFEAFLRRQGLAQVELKPLHAVLAYPRLLRHPKALGRVGILMGVK